MENLSPLAEPVEALMRQAAGRFIMPRYRNLSDGEHEEKAPGEDVTVADRDSEDFLSEHLPPLVAGSRAVGEEACSADAALLDSIGEGAVWLVDPLDGTTNFKNGEGAFAVMVALLAGGETLAAWLLDPRDGRLCHARRGAGAFVDGERVHAVPTGRDPLVGALSLRYLPPDLAERFAARAKGQIDTVQIPHCAGEQYPRLILGENDLTLFWRTLPWDHAPGALILEEAGGRIARFDGTPYRPGDAKKGLLAAASPALWERAHELLVAPEDGFK